MDILIKNIGGLPEDGDLTLTITPKGEIILGGCIFTHNFGKEVKAVALPKHGRLCDLDALIEHETYNIEQALFDTDEVLEDLKNTPVIVEANNGTDN